MPFEWCNVWSPNKHNSKLNGIKGRSNKFCRIKIRDVI